MGTDILIKCPVPANTRYRDWKVPTIPISAYETTITLVSFRTDVRDLVVCNKAKDRKGKISLSGRNDIWTNLKIVDKKNL
jgi:hypothetical protein